MMMMASRRFFPLGSFLLLYLLPSALVLGDATDVEAACDDGKVGKDIENIENWINCQGNRFEPSELVRQSLVEECVPTTEEMMSQCMDTALTYSSHPPSLGDYRLKRPKYGTYEYLPPQRWLSALQYGAVVFLYHPCTPHDQISQLTQLARSCLWRHFISPYPLLDSHTPMAVVSWGCVLRLKWVEPEKLKVWLSTHALHTALTPGTTTDGTYDEGLHQLAEKVAIDGKEVVCPSLSSSHHPPPLDSTTPPLPLTSSPSNTTSTGKATPTEEETKPPCNSLSASSDNESPSERDLDTPCQQLPSSSSGHHTSTRHHTSSSYVVLLSTACVVLLVLLLLFARQIHHIRRGQKRRTRYKSVSKFFPFSYGDEEEQVGQDKETDAAVVAIPEYGMPKSGRAEREMLLNESDEDEI